VAPTHLHLRLLIVLCPPTSLARQRRQLKVPQVSSTVAAAAVISALVLLLLLVGCDPEPSRYLLH
jgi:hypothetical protein